MRIKEICKVSFLCTGDLAPAPGVGRSLLPAQQLLGMDLWVRGSNTLWFGPTEKEKREKASHEGGDALGGGRLDSTPSLKNRESWAGEAARVSCMTWGLPFIQRAPYPPGLEQALDLSFLFCC